jgi:diguanylate cyclase (GGDEF)-like protein
VFTTLPGSLYPIALWAALAILAGRLYIQLRGLNTRLSVRFFVVLIAVAVLRWPETAAIAGVSALVESALWTRPRPSPMATVFHGAVAVLATSAAYATYHVPVGVSTPLLMVLAAIVYFVVSSLALAKFDARVWKQSFFWTFPHYIAGGSAAGLLTIADRHNGWQITLLVVPMLYWMVHAYKLYLDRAEQERREIEELSALHFRTIQSLAVAIEGRDPERRKHKRSVWSDALEIGRQLRLPEPDLLALRTAALLRNVGKLAVPEHILSKPSRLTKAEFDKMAIHPVAGAQIVEQAGFPYAVAPIVRSSHEKWDGTGYPDGLRGEQIPIGARILAAVDCLDALVSTRGYRRAYTLEQGMEHIRAESGKSFDPKVVEILANYYGELERRAGDTPTPAQDEPGISPIAAARQEVQQLFALAQDLGNSLSLEETFAVLSQHMKQLCPHDTLAVYIRREDRLEAEYATGLDCLQVGAAVVPWGEGVCGRAAASALALLNVDPLDHPDRPSVGGATSLRSALAIPLEGFSGVAGVLCLYAREQNAFTEDHMRILSAAATKVAVAVENALKYRQVERSAVTDMLTELPNARSLFLHLDSELARAQRTDQTIAVLVCDLDGFKQINDRFGHLEGNRVLRAVARGLRSQCREYDTVARLGGDEFVLVLPGQEPESVSVKVEQLIRAVAEAGYETMHVASLGISVGVAYYPDDGEDAEALLAVADQRMYREKQRGGAASAGASEVLA